MKFSDTLLGLVRRWYIVLPGLLITVTLAVGAWFAIPPDYSRSATQMLIPGEQSIPEGANPYLFLGGLAPAADVIVRAIGSENVLNDVVDEYPGIEIAVSRDTTTAGPIIIISVTASSDAAAENVLAMLIERTATVLDAFQEAENIPEANQMTVVPVTVDEQSTEQWRTRLIVVVGAGVLGTVLTLLVAGLVDGSSRRKGERRTESATSEQDDTAAPPPHAPVVAATSPIEDEAPARFQRPPSVPDDAHRLAASRSRVMW